MPFHSLRHAYFTGEKFVPDPGSFGDDGGHPFDYQSIIDQIARDQAEKQPEEQFATAEGDVTFEELIEQFEMERGQETAVPQPVPLPSALDGTAPSTEQPFGGIDMEPLQRLTDDAEEMGPMEPAPGMEPGMEEVDGETDDKDEDDYEGAFDEAEGILGPEKGDIDLGVPVTEDEDGDFGELPSPNDLIPEESDIIPEEEDGLDSETQDALEDGEMDEIFPDLDEGEAKGNGDYGLAKAILKGKERQRAAVAIARKIVADTINIDFTFNDEGKPEVAIDEGEEDLGDLGDEDLLGGEDEGDDLFGEDDDLFGEETGPKGKGDDLFDELGESGEGGEDDLFGEESGGEGEELLGI